MIRMTMRAMCHCKMRATWHGERGPYIMLIILGQISLKQIEDDIKDNFSIFTLL